MSKCIWKNLANLEMPFSKTKVSMRSTRTFDMYIVMLLLIFPNLCDQFLNTGVFSNVNIKVN
jgi:hypothetical protein